MCIRDRHKADLIDKLKKISSAIFRADNLMISYTSSEEGVLPAVSAFEKIEHTLNNGEKPKETHCILHLSLIHI